MNDFRIRASFPQPVSPFPIDEKPLAVTAPHSFFQLFPESNGIGEIIFLVLLAPVYLIARLVKYLFFENHTPALPHEWTERFGEALAYAERDLAGGLDHEELACYHSLLDHILNNVPEEIVYHREVATQLDEFRDAQESVSHRIETSYRNENAVAEGLQPILELLFAQLFQQQPPAGSGGNDNSVAEQIDRLREAEIARQDRLAETSLTPFEKEAIPLIAKNIVLALLALPESELIEIAEALPYQGPSLFSEFFPKLIVDLWLRGTLRLEPVANVSPTVINYVSNEGSLRKKLALFAWAHEKNNNISLSGRSTIFSSALLNANMDSLLARFCSSLVRSKGEREGNAATKALSEKIEKARISGKPTDKIALWNEVEEGYKKLANCNPDLLYELIETDPILKQSLQKQNGLELLRTYKQKLEGRQDVRIDSSLERQLAATNLFNLLHTCLKGKGGYPAIVGQMLGREYEAIVSQAIAHARMVTELQATSRDKSKSELDCFLAGIDQTLRRFHQGNPHFLSFIKEVLKDPVIEKFNGDVEKLTELLKTNANPSRAELGALANMGDPNKLLVLGWAMLFKNEAVISTSKLEPLIKTLCDVDFAEQKNVHRLLDLALNKFLDLKKTDEKQKRFDAELAWLAIARRVDSAAPKQHLDALGQLCEVDFTQKKNQELLFAVAAATLPREFDEKFDVEIAKLAKILNTKANPPPGDLEALQKLLIGIGLTNQVENRRKLLQLAAV